MQIKRYSAPDMRRALHQVRQAQGAQAVILSSRRLPDGVEVIAADDYDAALVERLAAAGDGDALPAGTGRELPRAASDELRAPADLDRLAWAVDPAISQLRSELTNLRALLEAELRQSAALRRTPLEAQLAQHLEQLGLAPALIGELLGQLGDTQDMGAAWRELLGQHLVARIPIASDDMLAEGGVVALLGPTGVGKTTTVAKLAARFVREHGARHLGLLTTDNYRVGAHEQLQNYGRLLGVPVQMVDSADDLATALAALANKRLVLVDTAGMSQRDLRLGEALASLRREGLRGYLTLASNAHETMLDETITTFGALPLAGCVLTKLDECPSLGGTLSAVIRHGLPIACVTDGQRVPEDMRPARARDLVSLAAQRVQARTVRSPQVSPAPIVRPQRVAAHA
ncbi:MAG: flagellar biosynthesis protein FlhF [Immundisolibacter sp.]|uniref:flagellar biosynthesis protein FlhF n=1 Tax=Immundisolibacter sp. TaxID=1934948 RepID=UPI003D115F6E